MPSNNDIRAQKTLEIGNQLDLQNAEAVADWTAGTDVTNLAVTTNHKTGQYAMEFDKSGGTVTGGTISASLAKNGYFFANHKLKAYVYMSAVADVASVSITLGTSASHNNVYTSSSLSDGWNELDFDCDSPTSTTGNGVNWYNLEYIALTVTMNNAADTLVDIALDTIYLYKANQAGATPGSDVNLKAVNGSSTALANAGNAGAGTQRVTIATDDVNLAAIKTAVEIMDDWDESDRAKVNPIAGQAGVAAGAGVVDALTQRSTLASDDPAVVSLQIMDDWDESDRAKVNLIAGQAGITAGAGAVGASTPRVTLASDDPAVTALQILDDWDDSDQCKVTGAIAHDAADSGNPIKIGGKYNAADETLDDGDRGDLQLDINGYLKTIDKSYDSVSDSIKNTRQNPDYNQFVNESLVDTTNVAAATNYYPSSSGFSMDGYSDLSYTGKFIDADGTVTVTVEGTNDEDSAGDWHQVYFYDDINNVTTNTMTVTNGTLNFAISLNDANFRYFRFVAVNDGATNTFIVKARRAYI